MKGATDCTLHTEPIPRLPRSDSSNLPPSTPHYLPFHSSTRSTRSLSSLHFTFTLQPSRTEGGEHGCRAQLVATSVRLHRPAFRDLD